MKTTTKITFTMIRNAILGAQFTINHIQHAHFQTLRIKTNSIIAGPKVINGQNHLKRDFQKVQKLD